MLILDILVFIFGISGALLLIFHNKLGFISFIIHSIIWGALSLVVGHYWAVLTCVVFICVDAFGYWKWSKELKTDEITKLKSDLKRLQEENFKYQMQIYTWHNQIKDIAKMLKD